MSGVEMAGWIVAAVLAFMVIVVFKAYADAARDRDKLRGTWSGRD